MIAINTISYRDVECKARNISPDGMGIGLFLNERVEIGSDISLVAKLGNSDPVEIRGQVRWRAGDKGIDGDVTKTEFDRFTGEKVTKHFCTDSIDRYFPEGKGFDYVIGMKLYERLPPEMYADQPEEDS